MTCKEKITLRIVLTSLSLIEGHQDGFAIFHSVYAQGIGSVQASRFAFVGPLFMQGRERKGGALACQINNQNVYSLRQSPRGDEQYG